MQSVRACSESVLVVVAGVTLATAPLCRADDGFQWATIGAVGNQAYQGSPGTAAQGRGRVDYEYKIGKLEITTAQWLEFTNTFSTQTDAYNFTKIGPLYWGASRDTRYTGPGVKYKLRSDPNAAILPVGGITWRDAARYCNWLHNGKSSDLNSLITGAYDTTTFSGGGNVLNPFTDARTHLPGAKYWIPTYDEWLKAAYYDPNRFGDNVGGWWTSVNKSNAQGTSGLPGAGTTSAGLVLPDSAQWAIPLGAYPQSVSPWGLLDTSGGATEWTEAYSPAEQPVIRASMGSYAGGSIGAESITKFGSSAGPGDITAIEGLRIASSVPSPGWPALVVVAFGVCSRRRNVRTRRLDTARG